MNQAGKGVQMRTEIENLQATNQRGKQAARQAHNTKRCEIFESYEICNLSIAALNFLSTPGQKLLLD